MTGIGQYRYEGFPLEQKVGWIKAGPGPDALADAQSALVDLTDALVASEERLRRLMADLGGSWQGTAAEAANAAVRQVAVWSADSSVVTQDAGTAVDMQVELAQRTRHGMPGSAPAPEYGFDDALGDAVSATTYNLFDVQTDFDEQAARRRAADEQANRILYEHEAQSRANLASLPALGEVPKITADSEPPATVCPPVPPVHHDVRVQSVERNLEVSETDRGKDEEDTNKDDRGKDETGKDDRGKEDKDDKETGTRAKEEKGGTVEPQPERDSVTTSSNAPVATPPDVRPAPQPIGPDVPPGQGSPRPGVVPGGIPVPVGRGGVDVPRPASGPGTAITPRTGVPSGPRAVGGAVGRGPSGVGSVPGGAPTPAVGRAALLSRGRQSGVLDGRLAAAPGPEVRGGRAGGVPGVGYGAPGVAGRGAEGDADAEHDDRYYQPNDDLFGPDDRAGIAPAVIGEGPEGSGWRS